MCRGLARPSRPSAYCGLTLRSSSASAGRRVYLCPGVEHDEALRRVLGLVRWDAAAELKEKIGLAGSEMAQQLRKVHPTCVCTARVPNSGARAHLIPVHCFTLPPPSTCSLASCSKRR